MDENTGTHQYNIRSTRVLICSNHISTIKILPHQRNLLFISSWGKWGGLLSFGRLVEDHRDLCIEINENMLLGFWKHDILPTMEWNLRLVYPSTVNKFNDTVHTSFVKRDIY